MFSKGLSVLALVLFASPTSAATMFAVYKGTVSSGLDSTGVFGTAGRNLAGAHFVMTYAYDTALGNRETGFHSDWMGSWYYDKLKGGTSYGIASPIISAFLTIEGSSSGFEFGGLTQGVVEVQSDDMSYTNYHHRAQSTGYGSDSANGDYVYGYTVDNWLSAPTGSSGNLEDASDLTTGPFDFPGSFKIYRYSYASGSYFDLAEGSLAEDTLSVSPRIGPAAVPLPSSASFFLGSILLTSFLGRRKKVYRI